MIDYTDEMVKKGTIYEEMTKSKGWEYIIAYVSEQDKSFQDMAKDIGFKSLEEYQFVRGQIVGLQKLINDVESSIQHLNKWRDTKRSGEDSDNPDSASSL